jgi:hypothetical protein
MTHRLLIVALTLGLSAAPLAASLCQVLCADVPAAAQQHSCHSDSAQASVTVTAVPHACGHSAGAPEAVEGLITAPVSLVAVLPPVPWSMPVAETAAATPAPVSPYPPGLPPPITQLRV